MAGPPAKDVARRLIILRAVAFHTHIVPPRKFLLQQCESQHGVDQFLAEVAPTSMAQWGVLRDSGLWKFIATWEKAYAETPPAQLSNKQSVDAMWKTESVTVLLWALKALTNLPPPFEHAEVDQIMIDLKMEIDEYIASVQLRSVDESEGARAVAELWYSRGQYRDMVESGRWTREDARRLRRQENKSIDGMIRGMVARAAADGAVDQVVDGDHGVNGIAYQDLPTEEWAETKSISFERSFAFNWLCGYAPLNR